MYPITIAFIVMTCTFGGASIGLYLGRVLPAHHFSPESKDAIKLVTGMIATLSALVLGLLVSSAKNSFDIVGAELRQTATQVILLDRVLAQYGSDSNDIRAMMRREYAARIEQLFSSDQAERLKVIAPQQADPIEEVERRIWQLVPGNDAQRGLQAQALQIGSDLARTHWKLIELAGSSIPMPFLTVLVSWLAAIFVAFGLFTPRNATAVTVLFVGALAVSTAILLIEAMDRPLEGLMSLSDAPMRNALRHLGQ